MEDVEKDRLKTRLARLQNLLFSLSSSLNCLKMTFSPSSSSSAPTHLHRSHHHHHLSYSNGLLMVPTESGYSSGLNLSRPLEFFDASLAHSVPNNQQPQQASGHGEAHTTPRTTAAINFMSALQLSTPRMGLRNGRKATTPLKRQQSIFSHSNLYETTPKKPKGHTNDENDTSLHQFPRSASMKVPFRARLDRSLSQTMSPLAGGGCIDKLDCTFDAISSSTPIGQPFRAEFYEQQVEDIPVKNLTRSGGKNTRTKLIRKMQSFSPRKLMGMRAAKLPLREMDQNSVDFQAYSGGFLCPVAEEESPIPKAKGGAVKKVLFSDTVDEISGGEGAFTHGLRELMFGTIKTDSKEVSSKPAEATKTTVAGSCNHSKQTETQENSSQLLDIYVTNLSNLDGGDSNSSPVPAEDGDISMNTSMVADVERYFDELKRNTTQVQDTSPEIFVPVTAKDSLGLYDMLSSSDDTPVAAEGEQTEKQMEVEPTEVVVPAKNSFVDRPPMVLRKRKRPSTELIQAVLATPKKMRRSQSFHVADGHSSMSDENLEFSSQRSSDTSSDASCLFSPTSQRMGGARKRLNYEPVPRNRFSPAKRSLAFEGVSRRRPLNGTQRLNIFRHLANCPPVRDYFFEFVGDKDLVAIFAVSRQCRNLIEDHPRLNARRLKYLEVAWRKKENQVDYSSGCLLHTEEPAHRIQGERSIVRVPLHNRNVDTSSTSSVSDTMSPPVSPSRRKFQENQRVSEIKLGFVGILLINHPFSILVGAAKSGSIFCELPPLPIVKCY